MKILADRAMPYWEAFFPPLGEVKTFSAGELVLNNANAPMPEELKQYLPEVECLLVRSTTQVNQSLIDAMPNLQFVATATAGYDHFDIKALNAAGIKWYNAGGCNAQAVAQYVVCALLHLAHQDRFLIQDKVVAVVGNGNVGTRVASAMRALGAKVIIYDPPQQSRINSEDEPEQIRKAPGEKSRCAGALQYVSFCDILRADIICIHAPLNSHKEYPSRYLFDENALSQLSSSQYVINAGRGEIIDNQALLTSYNNGITANRAKLNVVLDVWENEPTIMTELIPHLRLASAHIAGHTLEGKANGTFMLYQQVCEHYKIAQSLELSEMLPPDDTHLTKPIIEAILSLNMSDLLAVQELIKNICHLVYDIQNDDRVFRKHMAQFKSFAILRTEYPIRREFSALSLDMSYPKIIEILDGLGFNVATSSTTL